MARMLKPEERIVVAADFDPGGDGRRRVMYRVLDLAERLQGTGVYIKVNSALRALGYDLISDLHNLGLRVFADLKLVDIPNTLATDGELLNEFHPEIVTVMCNAGYASLRALRRALPRTEILGVTVLTSMDDGECGDVYGCDAENGVLRLAEQADAAGLNGLVLSPKENEIVRTKMKRGTVLTLNNAGIRPVWYQDQSDDQKRVTTPREAILGGAYRIILGRPIVQVDDPLEALQLTLDEVKQAVEELELDS